MSNAAEQTWENQALNAHLADRYGNAEPEYCVGDCEMVRKTLFTGKPHEEVYLECAKCGFIPKLRRGFMEAGK